MLQTRKLTKTRTDSVTGCIAPDDTVDQEKDGGEYQKDSDDVTAEQRANDLEDAVQDCAPLEGEDDLIEWEWKVHRRRVAVGLPYA